jgi:hypothetical protein
MFHIGDGDNARSIEIRPIKEDLADLDREFPPPNSKKSLSMLLAACSGLEATRRNLS